VATTFHVRLLTPEREVFAGPAVHLYARGTVGYFGVLANHAPLLTGGFLEISDNRATVLADAAELASEIDAAAAERALAEARGRLASPHLGNHGESDLDRERLAAHAEQAAARLAVWKEYGSGR
jgi:F-type H+-transporting ATPase subunit epsilon